MGGDEWKRQQTWFRDAEKHDPGVRGKPGLIIRACAAPPEACRVICIDELGPLSTKAYPGEQCTIHRGTWGPDMLRETRDESHVRMGAGLDVA